MKERELFVFSGQSNMMGACVYPPKEQIVFTDSFEYLHKPKRFGKKMGEFKNTGFPCGEFSYTDIAKAYGNSVDEKQQSELSDFAKNTFFCPAMSNLADENEHKVSPFAVYSEKSFQNSPCMPPFVVQGWEKAGRRCAYAHIAKGSTSILHFFDEEMYRTLQDCAKDIKLDINNIPCKEEFGAGNYFEEKVKDFFEDSRVKFSGDDLSTKAFFWLQGESDYYFSKDLYRLCLEILWKKLQNLGFKYFFCIRVGYWSTPDIWQVIKAQEEFCSENDNVYMLTRAVSMMPTNSQDIESWFIKNPEERYLNCRDSFYGFENQHINEKGFRIISAEAVENMKRIILQGVDPVLEEENLKMMV